MGELRLIQTSKAMRNQDAIIRPTSGLEKAIALILFISSEGGDLDLTVEQLERIARATLIAKGHK